MVDKQWCVTKPFLLGHFPEVSSLPQNYIIMHKSSYALLE